MAKATLFSKRFVFLESLENSSGWREINPILVEFARKKNVITFVSYLQGSFSKPIKDPGSFYIRFFSSPLEGGEIETTSYSGEFAEVTPTLCPNCGRFHILPDGSVQFINPSGLENSVVIKTDSSIPVAEVVDDTLYVLFNPEQLDSDNLATRMKSILTKVDEVYQPLPQTNGERGEKNQQKLEEFYQSYRAFFPDLPENECRKQFDFEYTRLVTSPGVESIMFTQNRLFVFTDRIIRSDTERGLGKYLITINFEDENSDDRGKINFQNLSCKEGEDEPHHTIENNGWACLGTIDDLINECLEKYEFAVLVQMLIAYLRKG